MHNMWAETSLYKRFPTAKSVVHLFFLIKDHTNFIFFVLNHSVLNYNLSIFLHFLVGSSITPGSGYFTFVPNLPATKFRGKYYWFCNPSLINSVNEISVLLSLILYIWSCILHYFIQVSCVFFCRPLKYSIFMCFSVYFTSLPKALVQIYLEFLFL